MARRFLLCAAVVAACGFTAFGETITGLTDYVYLKTADTATTPSFTNGTHWSDSLPPHDDADYIVQGEKQLRTDGVLSGTVFGGRSLTLDNGRLVLKVSDATFTINDLRLYNQSRIWNGNNSNTQTIIGKITVFGTEADPPLIGLTQIARHIILSGELVGDEDAVLKIGQNPGDGTLNSSNPCYMRLNATNENGNAGSYHGRFFSASRYANLVVKTVETLGAGDTQTHGSVIKLSGGGGFLGEAGLIFTNAAYSISINGTGCIGSYSAGPVNNELPLGGSMAGFYLGGGVEIKGLNGNDTLEIWNRSGAVALNDVRLSGISQIKNIDLGGALRFLADYNNPDVPVVLESGNRIIAGWCENIGPVTLGSGTFLSPGVNAKVVGTLGMESLNMANGAYITASLFQQEDGSVTSDLIRVKGNLTKGADPIEIRFDSFPSGTNGVVKGKLFTSANLGTAGGITTNDFAWRIQDDALNNIVTGELSIEQDADGTNYLYFTRTCNQPVYHTGLDSSAKSSFDSGTNWDNKQAPDADHDYIVPEGKLLRCYVSDVPFRGRSLSILNGGDFSICGVTAIVPDLRGYPGSRVATRVNGTANRLLGTLTVYGTKASPLDFMIESNAGSRQLTVGASLVGNDDAMVRFRCYTKGPSVTADTFTGGKYIINGDNSAYKGKINIHQNTIVAEFANELALGGPADAFAADRLILSSNAVFYCDSTYTLSDPTRGITIQAPDIPANHSYGGGNFRVTVGNTLTIQNVITGAGSLRKSGDGTLVLDSANTSYSGLVQPQAGKLAVRNKDALGTGKVKLFAAGTLRIETADGVTLTPAAPFDTSEASAVNVELAAFDAPTAGKIEANIFTLKNATEFDTSTIQIVNSGLGGNYRTEIQTKETETGLVVYATATAGGMVISIR